PALQLAQTKADATVTVEHPIALDHNVLRPAGTPLPKVDRVLRNPRLTCWHSQIPEQVVPHDPVNPFVDINAARVILVGPTGGKLKEAFFNATVGRPHRIALAGRAFDELLVAIEDMAIMHTQTRDMERGFPSHLDPMVSTVTEREIR